MMIASTTYSIARALVSLGCLLLSAFVVSQEICSSNTRTYTAKVGVFASGLGYYQFEECGDIVNPTITLKTGKVYTFVQIDESNYDHPMGFSYFPDGFHAGAEDLEPGISLGSDRSCADSLTCPSPMYFMNNNYFGSYSNIPRIKRRTIDDGNYGINDYERMFVSSPQEWASAGDFTIKLRFDDDTYSQDIFYFCRAHPLMSGRIKLIDDNGDMFTPYDIPPSGYKNGKPPFLDTDFSSTSIQVDRMIGGNDDGSMAIKVRQDGDFGTGTAIDVRQIDPPMARQIDLTGADPRPPPAPGPPFDTGDDVPRPTARPPPGPSPPFDTGDDVPRPTRPPRPAPGPGGRIPFDTGDDSGRRKRRILRRTLNT